MISVKCVARVNTLTRTLNWLIPTVVAPEKPLSSENLNRLGEAVMLYLKQNIILKVAFIFAIHLVNLLPLFTTGKTLRLHRLEKRQEYLNRMHFSRAFSSRGLAMLIGLPIKMIYYSQEAEQERLGFKITALREEAKLRVVSRQ